MFKKYSSIFASVALVLGSISMVQASDKPLQQQVDVESPVIFQLRPDAKGTGAKMTIHNNTDKDLIITGLSCEGFAQTMLHSTKYEGGKRVMFEVEDIVVPVNKKLAITPNTRHFMMFNPERKFELGEFLTLTAQTNQGEFNIIAQIVPRRLK